MDNRVNDEAVRRHLNHGEAVESDNRILSSKKTGHFGTVSLIVSTGTPTTSARPTEGNWAPLAQQTVEDDCDLPPSRVEPRYGSNNLVRSFSDLL